MKTIQISEGLWKRLRVEAAERGVTMREVVEGLGASWMSMERVSPRRIEVQPEETLAQAVKRAIPDEAEPRELQVELEEGG